MWNGLYRCPDFKHIASVQQFTKGSQTKRVDKNEKKMWNFLQYIISWFFFIITHPSAINATNDPLLGPSRMHTQQSRRVYRFRPHSACCSYFQKPSIVMFPSIYRCVFFLSIFFPTLNNRISDILWGGKLIFFSLLLVLSLSTAPIVYHFPEHNENACIYYLL